MPCGNYRPCAACRKRSATFAHRSLARYFAIRSGVCNALISWIFHHVVPYSRFITYEFSKMTVRRFGFPSTDQLGGVDFVRPDRIRGLTLPRRFRMAIQAHLVELERKHKILENELHEALVHLSTDDLQIVELKRRKLMVKDQIERSEARRRRNAPLVTPRNIVVKSRLMRIALIAGMRAVALIPAVATRASRQVYRCRSDSDLPASFADVVGDRQRRCQSRRFDAEQIDQPATPWSRGPWIRKSCVATAGGTIFGPMPE